MVDRRNRRWLSAAVVVASCLPALIAIAHYDAPSRRFQQGLRALDASDLERVEYERVALGQGHGFYSHANLLAGGVALRLGKLREAIEQFDLAVDHPATRDMALLLGGETQFQLGNVRAGERALLAALEDDPDIVAAHRRLAAVYFDGGAFDAAIEHLTEWARLTPGDPRSYSLSGRAYAELGRLDLAAAALQESLARNRQALAAGRELLDANAVHYQLAEVELARKNFDAALESLDHCQDDADVLALRAACFHERGDDEKARRTAKEALAKSARSVRAMIVLAQLDVSAGQAERAVERLKNACDALPSQPLLHRELAGALRSMGDDGAADDEEQLAVKTEGKLQALRASTAQLAMAPDDTKLRLQVAKQALELQMYEPARQQATMVLSVEPGNIGATRILRRVHTETANVGE